MGVRSLTGGGHRDLARAAVDASLGTIFGVALAAFLVTAAADVRAAVVDLLRRTFRWRLPARWYLIALLGVPDARASRVHERHRPG